MQKGGEGVQKACKNAYVINGRPLYGLDTSMGLIKIILQIPANYRWSQRVEGPQEQGYLPPLDGLFPPNLMVDRTNCSLLCTLSSYSRLHPAGTFHWSLFSLLVRTPIYKVSADNNEEPQHASLLLPSVTHRTPGKIGNIWHLCNR